MALQLTDTYAILTSEDETISIEISMWKDLLLVKGSVEGYKFEQKVLGSDIKYLPNLIHNADLWIEFYEKCVSPISIADFQKALKHVYRKQRERN